MSDPLVTIVALEIPRLAKVVAQFQPQQVVIDKTVPWQQQPHTVGDAPNLQYFSGIGRVMAIDLVFDGVKSSTSVQANLDLLQRMTRALDANGPDDKRRPPLVAVRFPGGKIPEFTGVIESLSIRYAQLLDDGTPVLASAMLRVRETAHVSVKLPS